jgi:hypothetical protein
VLQKRIQRSIVIPICHPDDTKTNNHDWRRRWRRRNEGLDLCFVMSSLKHSLFISSCHLSLCFIFILLRLIDKTHKYFLSFEHYWNHDYLFLYQYGNKRICIICKRHLSPHWIKCRKWTMKNLSSHIKLEHCCIIARILGSTCS